MMQSGFVLDLMLLYVSLVYNEKHNEDNNWIERAEHLLKKINFYEKGTKRQKSTEEHV